MDHDADDRPIAEDVHAHEDALPACEEPGSDISHTDAPAVVPSPLPPPSVAVDTIASPAWSRGELAGIAVAAIGGAAIVLTLLVPGARERGPTATMASPAGARGTAAPATAPASAAPTSVVTPAPAARGWQQAAEWVGRNRRSVAFEVQAVRPVRAWMQQVRPVLVVRCLAGSLDAFMVTGTATSLEPGRSDHTVRLAFDESAPVVQHWADSAEHDGLFAPDGTAFLGRLSNARTLRVSFTPHNSSEAEASFDVRGADDIVGPIRKHCRQR